MPYEIKPLSCDAKKLKGLSEKLIVSHWENNYGGAVKRLNGAGAGKHVDAFMENIRWDNVSRLHQQHAR